MPLRLPPCPTCPTPNRDTPCEAADADHAVAASLWRRSLPALLLALCVAGCSSTPEIALDVGHSLNRPGGTSARGVPEFALNRALAVDYIKPALEQVGFRVRLIGDDGQLDVLTDRTLAAQGSQFLLSIHHDAVSEEYLSSWEVDGVTRPYSDLFSGHAFFASRRNPYPAASVACASRMGAALLAQGMTPSLHHAGPGPDAPAMRLPSRTRRPPLLAPNADTPGSIGTGAPPPATDPAPPGRPMVDRLHGVFYYDNLVVLRTATMPAVLFEAGMMINRQDELWLQQSSTRRRIAIALASGLRDCLLAPSVM